MKLEKMMLASHLEMHGIEHGDAEPCAFRPLPPDKLLVVVVVVEPLGGGVGFRGAFDQVVL